MPLLHHAVLRALRGDGQAVKLAGEADGKIANINHLLHLAFAFGQNLSGFQRDQSAQVGFGRAQRIAELADNFAAFRRGQGLPALEGAAGPLDGPLVIGRGGRMHAPQLPAINGGNAFQNRSVADPFAAENAGVVGSQTEPLQEGCR